MKTLLLLLCTAPLWSAGGTFEKIASYRGLGGLVASSAGPGPAAGSERYYLSYLYLDNTIEVVSVDPATGAFEVFPNPAPGESGARCMVPGPDGNLYLGTLPTAHFLKLDTKTRKLIDLGRPSATEEYIWDVAFGTDGKLYGATYPHAKLVRYDPKSGKLEDLGRMDPVEQYARWIAGSSDGFVYIGIGTSRANIVAYEIATGKHREILPKDFQHVGMPAVYRGTDGKMYGHSDNDYFALSGFTCTPIAKAKAAPPALHDRLRDGRTVSADGRNLQLRDKAGKTTSVRFEYEGNSLPVFRVGFGPGGALYGSSILPIHLVKFGAGRHGFTELGDLGGGEIYTFLAQGSKLLMAAYSGRSPLMAFDPAKPLNLEASPSNPELVNFAGADGSWRPQALIDGPGGKAYVGAVSGYGKLGGPLTVWDVAGGKVEQHLQVIRDQSVITLAAWKKFIVGGTTTGGGGGSHPTQTSAKLFLWDTETRKVVYETVPVAGARGINDLVAAPNGLIYGIAGRSLFVFDPERREVRQRVALPFGKTVSNSAAVGPDGRIWGLDRSGVFAIDLKTNQAVIVAAAPAPITAGFGLKGNAIYLVCGPDLYRYTIQ
jgi:streptogramin lyase